VREPTLLCPRGARGQARVGPAPSPSCSGWIDRSPCRRIGSSTSACFVRPSRSGRGRARDSDHGSLRRSSGPAGGEGPPAVIAGLALLCSPPLSLSLLVWRRSSSTIAASPRRLVAIARCSATRRSGGAQSVDRGGEARRGWQRCSLEDACVSNGDRHDAAAESAQGWAGGGCDCLFGEWTKLLYFSVASSDES
jgi:hypothetical protein